MEGCIQQSTMEGRNHICTVVAGVWEARDFTLYHLVNNYRLYFVSSLPLGSGRGKPPAQGEKYHDLILHPRGLLRRPLSVDFRNDRNICFDLSI